MDERERIADSLLVLRCQRGEEAAFERLIAKYHNRLLYYVRRLVGDTHGADDVMQNVWLAIWWQISRLNAPQAFSVWAYRIARNQAVQSIRDRWREEAAVEEIPDVVEDDEPEFSEQDAARIHEALSRLPVAQREALTLRFLEEMSYEDIAEVMNSSIGTVRSRLYYGKRALRRELESMTNGT